MGVRPAHGRLALRVDHRALVAVLLAFCAKSRTPMVRVRLLFWRTLLLGFAFLAPIWLCQLQLSLSQLGARLSRFLSQSFLGSIVIVGWPVLLPAALSCPRLRTGNLRLFGLLSFANNLLLIYDAQGILNIESFILILALDLVDLR